MNALAGGLHIYQVAATPDSVPKSMREEPIRENPPVVSIITEEATEKTAIVVPTRITQENGRNTAKAIKSHMLIITTP